MIRRCLAWPLIFIAAAAVASGSGRGLAYRNDRIRNGQWSIHVLQIDRSRSDFKWTTTLARKQVLGVSTLSQQIATVPDELGRPIAAMNGGFFREHDSYAGDPRGLQIANGELVSAPDGKACFWIDPLGNPHTTNVDGHFQVTWPNGERSAFGLNEARDSEGVVLFTPAFGSTTGTSGGREYILERAGQLSWLPIRAGNTYTAVVREVRTRGNSRIDPDTLVLSVDSSLRVPVTTGSVLKLSLATAPDLRGVRTALGAGPVLVRDGAVAPARVHKSSERHPRAAIGWNATHYFLVAVDGRQPGLSVGMTLPELAAYLVKLGCDQAMNLDGGGSVELWIDGRIANSPCYGHERPTANAIVLVESEKAK